VSATYQPFATKYLFITKRKGSTTLLKQQGVTNGNFGLKTFLTCSEGFKIESPLFFRQSLKVIQKASRNHSRKQKGSRGREKARKALVRRYEDITNRRQDWFWKLAHELTDQFDVLVFETLNLKAMQRLWGRKINDLAFREFLAILEWVAKKKGKWVTYIDRWFPSSKTCSGCGHILESLALSVRRWRCPACQSVNDRDESAAVNIKQVGVSTWGVGDVSQALPAISV